jgi:FimV-like protein
MSLLSHFKKLFSKKKPTESKVPSRPKTVITSQDIKAIAGDNVMATQLDLARAYIEIDKKNLAKKILNHVILNGDSTQQQQAQELIEKI